MTRRTALLVLGIVVLIAPFVGLPHSILVVLLPVCGVLIAGAALTLPKKTQPPSSHETQTAAL